MNRNKIKQVVFICLYVMISIIIPGGYIYKLMTMNEHMVSFVGFLPCIVLFIPGIIVGVWEFNRKEHCTPLIMMSFSFSLIGLAIYLMQNSRFREEMKTIVVLLFKKSFITIVIFLFIFQVVTWACLDIILYSDVIDLLVYLLTIILCFFPLVYIFKDSAQKKVYAGRYILLSFLFNYWILIPYFKKRSKLLSLEDAIKDLAYT